jgi:hypothetical protein
MKLSLPAAAATIAAFLTPVLAVSGDTQCQKVENSTGAHRSQSANAYLIAGNVCTGYKA